MSEILTTRDPGAPDERVEDAEPLIRRIVRWRLGTTAAPQDQEDVIGDIILELLSRQDSVRRGNTEPISDFAAYTAVAAHHGCDRYLRRRFPQRYRLGTRVRYLIEKTPEYAIWQEGESLVCARSEWRGRAIRADLQPGWTRDVTLAPRSNEARTVSAIFDYVGSPLRLPDLIEAVATLLNIHDQVVSASDVEIAGQHVDADDRLHLRRTLEELWREVTLLPGPQRVALLLNLRDEDGGCALTSLPATGVASIREIARVVELPAEEFAAMWSRLPLNDLEIAGKMGVSRQQVINLRKAARQRLGRRMAGNIDRKPDSK